MVERLNEPESRFHASLVRNVFDLVELLPRLNVNHDEELNRFAVEVKDRLCGFSAHDLKRDKVLRATTASDAAQILSKMDAAFREWEIDPAEEGHLPIVDIASNVDAIFSHMSSYMEVAT